ncbi:unnamed protein product [Amoebophrya sp. A25]|nr:unnamed protein product [Amoebophrya sp. A25]|eukprot:GSA25T00022207001.1
MSPSSQLRVAAQLVHNSEKEGGEFEEGTTTAGRADGGVTTGSGQDHTLGKTHFSTTGGGAAGGRQHHTNSSVDALVSSTTTAEITNSARQESSKRTTSSCGTFASPRVETVDHSSVSCSTSALVSSLVGATGSGQKSGKLDSAREKEYKRLRQKQLLHVLHSGDARRQITVDDVISTLEDLHELERDLHKCNFQRQLLRHAVGEAELYMGGDIAGSFHLGAELAKDFPGLFAGSGVGGTEVHRGKTTGAGAIREAQAELEEKIATVSINVGRLRRMILELTTPSDAVGARSERDRYRAALNGRLYLKKVLSADFTGLNVTCRCLLTRRSKFWKEKCRVVARFDHHCPWVDNAIGLGNQREFYLFLFFSFLLDFLWFLLFVCHFARLLSLGVLNLQTFFEPMPAAAGADASSTSSTGRGTTSTASASLFPGDAATTSSTSSFTFVVTVLGDLGSSPLAKLVTLCTAGFNLCLLAFTGALLGRQTGLTFANLTAFEYLSPERNPHVMRRFGLSGESLARRGALFLFNDLTPVKAYRSLRGYWTASEKDDDLFFGAIETADSLQAVA